MNMKKSLMMVMLTMISAFTFAQSHDRGHEKHGKHGDGQIEKMKADLALTDNQYASIKDISEKYSAKQKALRGDSSARNEKYATMKTLRQEKEKEIQAVLTPEQKTKWATFNAQHDQARKAKSKERLESRDAKMKSALSLSDDQFAKMQMENKTFREKVMTLRDQSKNEKSRDNSAFKKLKTEHDAAIKNILTEDQFKKWTDSKRERKNVHHGHEHK
jgi:Spy/CpxP family protein refolding chaperone